MTEELPTQPSLRRLRQFGVRPKRDLGQNFLIDSNILGVIERAADLGSDDVVLEIGGGLGVLSEHLAAHAAHVHVVEVDRALVPALEDALAPHPNTTLHVADALDLDLGALAPAPTKVVANLPYGIAASAILRTIEELDGVTRWVAMVQREVGERFAAAAGHAGLRRPQRARPARLRRPRAPLDRAHGLPSGPQRRLGPGRPGPHRPRAHPRGARPRARRLRPPPQGARALARAEPGPRPRRARSRPRGARCSSAIRPTSAPSASRPRSSARSRRPCVSRSAPAQGAQPPGGGTPWADRLHESAPAKVNLCLYVGQTREDGRHELVSIFQPIALTDEVELEPGGLGSAMDRVICPGVEGENLAAVALRRFRERTGWNGGPVRIRIEKRIPIAAGMAGGSADAGAALRLVARAAGIEDDALLREIGAGLGADVAAQVRPRATWPPAPASA